MLARQRGTALWAASVATMLVACGDDSRGGPPCDVTVLQDSIAIERIEKVDLLFVVDGSGSMAEEQAALAMQMPRMALVLAAGDADGDGEQDFPPIGDLHIGIVSADMGTGGHAVSFDDVGSGTDTACEEPELGDDGLLRTEGSGGAGCMAVYPPFLSYRADAGTDPAAFATDVGCVAVGGTRGCGYEQPLEAALKAVTSSSSELRFQMGTTGHGDGAHADFVRSDSLLAIIVVTDEDDCSVPDPELFNPTSTVYSGDASLRCFSYPTSQHPTERYVDGLLALRDDPHLLMFGAVAGVPVEAVEDPDAVDYDELLAHPAMQEMVDPANPERLRPACDVPGAGQAFPARRIVSTAQGLRAQGVSTLVQSICQGSWTPILFPVIEKLSGVQRGFCLSDWLTPPGTGLVECEVTETLPASGDYATCSSLPGRELLRVDDSGREVCRVEQLPVSSGTAPDGDGWYYDYFTTDTLANCGPDGQGISYTAGDEPRPGTVVEYECVKPEPAPWAEEGDTTIGSSCLVDSSVCGSAGGITGALTCDARTNTCQKGCGNDADCTASGLDGWLCGTGGVCENPSCP